MLPIEKYKNECFECFHFSKIHDCVGKASSTAANQDRVTVNSYRLLPSSDSVFTLDYSPQLVVVEQQHILTLLVKYSGERPSK